jgi:hypothetical protein
MAYISWGGSEKESSNSSRVWEVENDSKAAGLEKLVLFSSSSYIYLLYITISSKNSAQKQSKNQIKLFQLHNLPPYIWNFQNNLKYIALKLNKAQTPRRDILLKMQ